MAAASGHREIARVEQLVAELRRVLGELDEQIPRIRGLVGGGEHGPGAGADEGRRGLEMATRALRREMRWRTWLATAASLVLALGVLGIWETSLTTSRQIADSNRRWCPMVALFIPGPGEPPPTTDRGRQIVAQARTLSASFGCS